MSIQIICLVAIFSFATACQATPVDNVLKPKGLSLAEVQALIDAAPDGARVVIPAGDVTWSSGIKMPLDKTLRVEGEGIGRTIIRASNLELPIFTLGPRGHTIGNIETHGGSIIISNSLGFRIHHMRFYSASTKYVCIYGALDTAHVPNLHWGIVDNCEMINARVLPSGAAAMLSENNSQHKLWAVDAPLGTQYAVYVEDCTFELIGGATGNIMDGNYGGRWVFRYNHVKNSIIEIHSVQGNNRAMRTWEIYNNTIEGGSDVSWTAMFIRGGTGVVFNNILKNQTGDPIKLNNVRDTGTPDVCGMCNGTSNWDQNKPGESGWACRDQIGRGKDSVLWDGASAYKQESDPAYFWNNINQDGEPVFPSLHDPSTPPHILANRDYFNMPKPNYTPYTYPHPLRKD